MLVPFLFAFLSSAQAAPKTYVYHGHMSYKQTGDDNRKTVCPNSKFLVVRDGAKLALILDMNCVGLTPWRIEIDSNLYVSGWSIRKSEGGRFCGRRGALRGTFTKSRIKYSATCEELSKDLLATKTGENSYHVIYKHSPWDTYVFEGNLTLSP